jgi:G:T-mismatch repair DNA endonuclease (very short patch repair protein)
MKKGSKRNKNLVNKCRFCEKLFQCCDPKSSACDNCKLCLGCGIALKRVAKNRCCRKCQKQLFPTTLQLQQLRRLHESIKGENNPSKRIEVRKKLSNSKKGKLNPAYKYPEKWKAHIAKYRPKNKISKLEDCLSTVLQGFIRQYEVGWYKLDFGNPEIKLAVEVQGCWWHSCNKCFQGFPKYASQKKNKNNDIRKKKYLIENGWAIIYVYEHDFVVSNLLDIKATYVSR